eukprot:COSAG02_NODE_994_length_15358_cov_42.651812_6_plen_247_part_00
MQCRHARECGTQAQAAAATAALQAQLATANGPRNSFFPATYGADPSGVEDSTAALQHAITLAMNASRHGPCDARGDPACGTAVVDLQRGIFLVSTSLNWTGSGGNWEICCGTLVASKEAEGRGWPLIAVTGLNNGHQNIAFSDLALDGGMVGDGLFLLNVLRARLSGLYVVNYHKDGVVVQKGHEVDIHDSFFGQCDTVACPGQTQPPQKPQVNSSVNIGSTAIVLAGNDHFVHDCVIFNGAGEYR